MGFFRDLEDSIKDLGRSIDDNILQPIKDNPLGVIVDVGLLAAGVPPMFAAAAGGATNAAANGGNILEGALKGGIAGYVGGVGAEAAGAAGAGTIASGAAGGAAAGAAGAALNGGNIGTGIFAGGLTGGAIGTYYDAYGSPISGASNQAPVYEYDAASGQIVPVGTAGQVGVDPNVAPTNLNTVGTNDYSGGLDVSRPIYNVGDDNVFTGPQQPIEPTPVDTKPYDPYADEGPSQPGVETPRDPGVVVDDAGQIDIVDTRPVPPVVTPPVVTPPVVTPPVVTPPEPPIVDPDEIVHHDVVPDPETPVVPPVVPLPPPTTETPTTTDGSARHYITADQHNVMGSGLNPGFIQATPFYNTHNDVQSQYYWGGHGYQGGTQFDPNQYNSVAAPVQPWGNQQQVHPLTGQQINGVIQGHGYEPTPYDAAATRAVGYNPVQPVAPVYGQVQMTPTYGYTIQQ